MSTISRLGGNRKHFSTYRFVLALAVMIAISAPAYAQKSLLKISGDQFQNPDSQHRTEVEPDTFAWGSTIVSTFQVARVFGGGGADIGWATSINGGKNWTAGYLPGLTVNYKNGPYAAASDPAVVYDAKHG